MFRNAAENQGRHRAKEKGASKCYSIRECYGVSRGHLRPETLIIIIIIIVADRLKFVCMWMCVKCIFFFMCRFSVLILFVFSFFFVNCLFDLISLISEAICQTKHSQNRIRLHSAHTVNAFSLLSLASCVRSYIHSVCMCPEILDTITVSFCFVRFSFFVCNFTYSLEYLQK